jgi:biopolymer transport protein ExbB
MKTSVKFKRVSRFAAAAALIAPLAAAAWWSPDWTARKEITLNTTATGANLTAAVPEPTLLLRLHQGNFPQFLNVRDGGADFRLVAGDDQTPLKYHLERFDPITEIALVWVKLPAVNPQSTTDKLYLYFANGAAVKGEEAGASFDAATVAAFHFGESQGLPVDSTAYGTPVTAGEAFPNAASIVGTGTTLPGTQALTLSDNGALALDPTRGFTLSTWLRLNELPTTPAYVFDRQSGTNRLSVLLEGGTLKARLDGVEVTATAPLAPAAWAHVAVVVAPTELQLFVNGVLAGSAPATPAAMTGAISVGGAADGSGLLAADLDELRVANTARSADWLLFESGVAGERNDAIVTYGADQTGEGGEAGSEEKASYFSIIFQSVFGNEEAIVEQVVIGVCAVMMLIAMLVMFMKGLYLSKARGASNRFLKAYASLQIGGTGEMGLDSLVDKSKRFDASPLFHVYRQALLEVRKRRNAGAEEGTTGLDDKAMGSIRAAMDAVMVRQQQKMNALMVLLTIAISGGPFIGLFGTVVGVMVTFAAIAATGDVNINAIAPGMAAALLATVAGLGVAIPSLFGYNYLGSKVKELSADMHVYADELTARVVEEFGH